MRILLGSLMFSNAELFLLGALQHAGVAIGPYREPRIIPATIVDGGARGGCRSPHGKQ